MKRVTKRRILDSIIFMITFILISGFAGVWALLLIPYGMWCYYDGETRATIEQLDLEDKNVHNRT